jgi:DNA-binding SARP family transcriptional activator
VSALDFRVLGPLEVRRDGELVSIAAPKQRALLGLLLLRANEAISQDELIDQLWGEDAPPTARASLQNQVHGLRATLGAAVIERLPAGYVLYVEPEQLDLARFERLVAQARRGNPRERAAKLRDALACWRGPPLVEFPTEPFAQHEINRLEEARLTTIEERIEADLELDRHAELVAELEALVTRYPLRERFWAQLMLALYRAGRQADALAAYRRAHHTFTSELAVEPGVVLRDLQRAILVQDPALDDGELRIGSTLERAAAILPMQAREQAESLYQYGAALLHAGTTRQGVSTLEAAARLAAGTGERLIEERARLYLAYLSIFTDGKSLREHQTEAERAAALFEDHGDDQGLVLALRSITQMLAESGRADEAAEVAARGIALAQRSGDTWEEARLRGTHSLCLARGTRAVAATIEVCHEQLAEAVYREKRPFAVWIALMSLYAQVGHIDEARRLADKAMTEARETGMVLRLSMAMEYAATSEFSAGNLTAAATHLRSAYMVLETEDDHAALPTVAAELACTLAHTGDLREATELALSARARTSPDIISTETLWRRALALVAAQEGRGEEALRLSNEACARAAATDWLTFRGETLEEAATVHELAGDAAGAHASRREALETYERKGNIVGAERMRRRLENDA